MEELREWSSGAHRLWFEPPDMLWGTLIGKVSPRDSRWLLEACAEVATGGRFYVIADVAQAVLPTESLKYLADHVHPEWECGVVYLGVNPEQRAAGRALAVALLFTRATRFETVCVDSFEEARAWVDAHRMKVEESRRQVG
ncbi:hypothetical protein DRW03_16975 [Corallococcus sp. H22C18031201]|uniref:hypothetical protein n=1 Tax=Citreicoccus inhibens TaxID=2849499 RepID=UPI000E72893F|nr:hypothetical protein [Citreicoccus inhibens]MBU8897331.1 hypothetical protein [Citreicoccus inhibens]RJS21111.1 hypothetical protein DRW03_16975 [Corallococcus sp. H22C18031201]